ncbi:molybdenum cofactor guanylyltransferase [Paracnuella aquatica]|uniref:molybdenum cofactor guanylyltransferase n=1 Tax=Paracnuella aquatica TaxID=2268757 RepID=UPI001390528C|nr:molybdenum cofactor guanylyltransferase [Paracnuella aquatica]
MSIAGVVLCGGESARMGVDKGLLERDGRTWAQLAFDKLASFNIPVCISVNSQNVAAYKQNFDPALLIQDNEQIGVGGPLKGLLSVHQAMPNADLLVLAVDMPHMHQSVLETLIEQSKRSRAEALVYQNENQLEPLCGIYTASGLRKIFAAVLEQRLPRFSMHYVLSQMTTLALPVAPGQKRYFINCNSPEDLSDLE